MLNHLVCTSVRTSMARHSHAMLVVVASPKHIDSHHVCVYDHVWIKSIICRCFVWSDLYRWIFKSCAGRRLLSMLSYLIWPYGKLEPKHNWRPFVPRVAPWATVLLHMRRDIKLVGLKHVLSLLQCPFQVTYIWLALYVYSYSNYSTVHINISITG